MRRGDASRPGTGRTGPYERAQAAHRAGRLEEAMTGYFAVLGEEPDHTGALRHLGELTGRFGGVEAGLALLDHAIETGARDAAVHVDRAMLLHQLGRIDEALAAGLRAVEIDSSFVRGHCFLAFLHEHANRRDAARSAVTRALELEPDDPHAVVILARLERRAGDLEPALARIEAVLQQEATSPAIRQRAMHEHGLLLDRTGRYAEAFAALEESGRLALEDPGARRIDQRRWPDRIDAYRQGIDAKMLKVGAPDDGGPAPTFLLGFPRSGTTMTESVLSAHRQIVTTDERPFLHAVHVELARLVDGPDVVAQLRVLDEPGRRRLRATYWKAVEDASGRPDAERVFIDKLPLNIVDAALINVVFPDARLIVALRDPRDVCVSCLMQNFQLNAAMIHLLTMERIVAFYAAVMGLWLHVRPMLTLPSLNVHYERTVTSLESEARRLLDWLELDWDSGVLRFHEQARSRDISTPSFEAVTEPVHRRSVGRWRHYERELQPHLKRLVPFVEAFDPDA